MRDSTLVDDRYELRDQELTKAYFIEHPITRENLININIDININFKKIVKLDV